MKYLLIGTSWDIKIQGEIIFCNPQTNKLLFLKLNLISIKYYSKRKIQNYHKVVI